MNLNSSERNTSIDTTLSASNITDLYNVTLSNITVEGCVKWIKAEHVLFHMSGAVFVIGFLIPFTLNRHVILSRGCLVIGSVLVVLWSSVVVCHQDTLLWYVVYCIIHVIHCGLWLWSNWPVGFSESEDIYIKMFKPLKMSRGEFNQMMSICQIKDLHEGELYAQEDVTRIGKRLTILISGR